VVEVAWNEALRRRAALDGAVVQPMSWLPMNTPLDLPSPFTSTLPLGFCTMLWELAPVPAPKIRCRRLRCNRSRHGNHSILVELSVRLHPNHICPPCRTEWYRKNHRAPETPATIVIEGDETLSPSRFFRGTAPFPVGRKL